MHRLAELAALVGGEVLGSPDVPIRGVAPFEEAGPDQIALALRKEYLSGKVPSRAGAWLVDYEVEEAPVPAIRVRRPRLAFARLLEHFAPRWPRPVGVHPTAVVGENVTLGEGVSVGPHVTLEDGVVLGDGVTVGAGVYIGHGVTVGEGTTIYPNAVIREGVRIGRRCIIHANAVIGSDGYGFVTVDGYHHKVPQIGGVEIGDEVEIGACVTVDRSTCGMTRIGSGTKIGNLSQVAHNVVIGEHCLIVGMGGIAGSSRLGDHVILAGQVGVGDHVTVGDATVIAAKSMVIKDLPGGVFVSGIPARDHRQHLRQQAALERLPELLREVAELKRRLAALEGTAAPEGGEPAPAAAGAAEGEGR